MIVTWRKPGNVHRQQIGGSFLRWPSGGGFPFVATLVWGSRVHETSKTAGTGPLTLLGAEFNKRTFASVLNPGDNCYGFIASQHTNNMWEVTLFTMKSDGTLSRAAVPVRSSNAGALVNFDGKALDVVLDVPENVMAANLVTVGYTVVAR